MKSVCFLADDGAYGSKLTEHFGGVGKIEKSLCSINGKLYLFGNLVRPSKMPKKGNANVAAYDVQWEDLVLGETKIDLQVVVPAIELLVRVRRRQKLIGRKLGQPRKKYCPDKLFDDRVVKSLFVVHEGEDGDPMDSDTTDEDENENKQEESDDDDELFVTTETKQKEGSQSYLGESITTDTEGSSRFQWRAGQNISPHPSVVKPESVGCFRSLLSSFLVFVPLKLLKYMVYFSNMYADLVLAATESNQISVARWPGDISIAEMMAFFGIIIKMVLRPTPGQSYASAWKAPPTWHPYTRSMSLRRFQQIQADTSCATRKRQRKNGRFK
jgi:hypothetical protein